MPTMTVSPVASESEVPPTCKNVCQQSQQPIWMEVQHSRNLLLISIAIPLRLTCAENAHFFDPT